MVTIASRCRDAEFLQRLAGGLVTESFDHELSRHVEVERKSDIDTGDWPFNERPKDRTSKREFPSQGHRIWNLCFSAASWDKVF